MSDIETVGNAIIDQVDWRNDSSEDVYYKMKDICEIHEVTKFTIDDLKPYFNDADIAEIMQCYNIAVNEIIEYLDD